MTPLYTTDLGIEFLPFEGLYAEVTRHPQIISQLQREYKIIITGPTTLAAMPTAYKWGFKTLAIQNVVVKYGKYLQALKKNSLSVLYCTKRRKRLRKLIMKLKKWLQLELG